MRRQLFKGNKMYAIFSDKSGKFVQPCVILEVDKSGFLAECHNGGESGFGKGTEYFCNEDIGSGVYFSKY